MANLHGVVDSVYALWITLARIIISDVENLKTVRAYFAVSSLLL